MVDAIPAGLASTEVLRQVVRPIRHTILKGDSIFS